MLLACNFEEITALTYGARQLLQEVPGRGRAVPLVSIPPSTQLALEGLLLRLEGDLSIHTLAEQRELQHALQVVVLHLRETMEEQVAETHPADEGAVAAYFDFAHSHSVLSRVREMGEEMLALVEVMTGSAPDDGVTRSFVFPD